jgi:hypothetical protein
VQAEKLSALPGVAGASSEQRQVQVEEPSALLEWLAQAQAMQGEHRRGKARGARCAQSSPLR